MLSALSESRQDVAEEHGMAIACKLYFSIQGLKIRFATLADTAHLEDLSS